MSALCLSDQEFKQVSSIYEGHFATIDLTKYFLRDPHTDKLYVNPKLWLDYMRERGL